MPNFEAKESQEFQRLYPEYDAGPKPEREPLCKMADGTACNHYYMHSKLDTIHPPKSAKFYRCWLRWDKRARV